MDYIRLVMDIRIWTCRLVMDIRVWTTLDL